jgi:hypothetical protein
MGCAVTTLPIKPSQTTVMHIERQSEPGIVKGRVVKPSFQVLLLGFAQVRIVDVELVASFAAFERDIEISIFTEMSNAEEVLDLTNGVILRSPYPYELTVYCLSGCFSKPKG